MQVASAITIHRDPGGAWELAERAVPSRLRGPVRRFAGFRERAPRTLRRREVPGSAVTVVLSFAAPYSVAPAAAASARGRFSAGRSDRGPGRVCAPLAGFAAPLSARPALTELHGDAAGVQLDLDPCAARMLFGLPLAELPEPAVDLAELLGPEATLLAEELAGLDGWARRFARVDAFLERRLGLAATPPASVEWAWRALRASGGRTAIGALAEEIGCSRRHLAAGFRDAVGVPPKTAAAILRFERAAARLGGRGAGPVPLGRVAAECGYYDQSHMTREFRRLAGATPAAFVRAAAGSLGVDEGALTG